MHRGTQKGDKEGSKWILNACVLLPPVLPLEGYDTQRRGWCAWERGNVWGRWGKGGEKEKEREKETLGTPENKGSATL